MANTFWVRSTLPVRDDGGDKVVLWERNPAHPTGEVFIAGPTPVEVGETPRVRQLVIEGILEKVEPPEESPPAG